MVHAHEADHLERDAPHGQHGAEGDPAFQEPCPFRGTAEGVAQVVPHHVDCDRAREPGIPGDLLQVPHRGFQPQKLAKRLFVRSEQVVDDREEHLRPLAQTPLLPERIHCRKEPLNEVHKAAQESRRGRVHAGQGRDALEQLFPPGHGIAQQKPLQAEAPGVLLEPGQAHLLFVAAVPAPPDVSPGNPRMDLPHRLLVHAEPGPHGRLVQQVHDERRLEALRRQIKDGHKGIRQLGAPPERPVGYAVRDAARIPPVHVEHGPDKGCISLDIRCHDQHVPRLQPLNCHHASPVVPAKAGTQ